MFWLGCGLISTYILSLFCFFFFNDTATTEIYTLSLHDALPIRHSDWLRSSARLASRTGAAAGWRDRKSTRLNSSHITISYAVFCLKKKRRFDRRSRRGGPARLPRSAAVAHRPAARGRRLVSCARREARSRCAPAGGLFFFLVIAPPPRSTIFPYTTLFR